MDDDIVHFSPLEPSCLSNQFKAQPAGHVGFRVFFFVLIFVEALHGPPFFIVGVRDCRYVSAKLPPSLMVIQELFTRASTNRFVVLAVAVGLVRVNNCPE